MPVEQKKKYAAFISYRHLSPDKEIAQALHRMLEHNQVRPNRKVPRNIRPVFLDTGELPTLENLDAGILDALDNSECLFVICSPNLPLSKYCMREIEHFKKLHGGSLRRIYTILVDGEPGEAFPEILRSERRISYDEKGVPHEELTEVEPLFADVRAPSIRESIRKLRRTEYMRLAAAYYGCSYDKLYKRRKRWIWKIVLASTACAAFAVAGFGFYAHMRNLQYDSAKSATYATYAEERTAAGEEMLAISLCEEAWDAATNCNSSRYMTALRSAAVKHDFKMNAMPVSEISRTEYDGDEAPVLYLSENGKQLIIQSDFITQISDAKTGAVYQKMPTDSLALQEGSLNRYTTIQAEPDENGTLWDTVTLWNLEDNSLINRFAFRESGLVNPKYKLMSIVETDDVLVLMDNNEPVAYMTSNGVQLSMKDAAQIMVETVSEPESTAAPFYVSLGNKLKKTKASVKNEAGETVLELDDVNPISAFSADWKYFGYIHDGMLSVYNTEDWLVEGKISIPEGIVHQLHILEGSTYALIVYRTEDWWWKSSVIDWETGLKLKDIDGYAHVNPTDQMIYSMGEGKLSRYHYTGLDLANHRSILLHADGSSLAYDSGTVYMMDENKGEILFSAPCTDENSLCCAADLSKLLVLNNKTLKCFNQHGSELWSTGIGDGCFALSPDGSIAAWEDTNGNVHVVNADDKCHLFDIPMENIKRAGNISDIEVGENGVCIAGWAGALWFPMGEDEGIWLGEYSSVYLNSNGLLMLEGDWQYVMDFRVWDTKTHQACYCPAENTGLWDFSEISGYLVRHVQTSGNHATNELKILKLNDGIFAEYGTLHLSNHDVSSLRLDATGEFLNVTAGDETTIYRLQDMNMLVRSDNCPMYYEGGRIWSLDVFGGVHFSAPFLNGQELHDYALEMITGLNGIRSLSDEERGRYSFVQ